VALPAHSYLIHYFDDLDQYYNVGPPVYFVVQGLNVTNITQQRALCGSFTTCNVESLGNILEQERKVPNISYIAEPSSIWIDDFMYWLDPSAAKCCRTKDDGTLCQPSSKDTTCKTCLKTPSKWSNNMTGFPEGPEFIEYLSLWLQSMPSAECTRGGRAAYSNAVVYDQNSNMSSVTTSWIRTYHTPLKTQKDYIAAYQSAMAISERASEANDMKVFPYSIFYVFFEQYSTIVKESYALLASAIIAVSLFSLIFLGSFRMLLIFLIVLTMITVDLVGFVLGGTGVTLNAISLVNLLMSVGISCEFCCHISKAFRVENFGSRKDRVHRALVDIGASVRDPH
jgi:Niemann-Pick C1 protein